MSEVYKVQDVMKIMSCSKSVAYRIMREINEELKAKGKIIVAGRVNKKIFEERVGV